MSRNHRNHNGWIQKKHNKRLERQAWREHWEKTQNEAFTLEEVGWLVAGAESEGWVFEPDATSAIFERLAVHNKGYWTHPENTQQAMGLVLESAIYHPTRGIDRRAEYGVK